MAKPGLLPTATRAAVSIVRYQLEQLLGKDTLRILAARSAEDGHKHPDALIDDWLKSPAAQKEIETALEKADACVLQGNKGGLLQQIALQLPQRRLPGLVEVIAGLPEASSEQALEDALRRGLQSAAKGLEPELVELAVAAYMACLREALLSVENQALLVTGRAVLRTEQELKQFRQEVQALFQQLRQDLHYPISAHPLPPPLDKPPRAEYFTGREAELDVLLASLQPGRVVTLCGPGGMGKTALAVEAIWNLAPGAEPPERFPDGILFYSFYGQPAMAQAFEYILRSYDPQGRDSSAQAVQLLLSRKKALLVLDGAEQAENLLALLELRGGCGVLVTTRRADDAPAAWQELEPLKPEQAVKLLQDWGGKWAADVQAAGEICSLLGGLPLAVRLVGAYLCHHKQKAAAYLAWLKTSPLQALAQGKRRLESVPLLLERSLAQVSPAARDTLALVGRLALAPFTAEMVAAGRDIPLHEVERDLGELVSYSLLQRPDERYQVSHALVHTFAHEQLLEKDDLPRLAEYCIQLAERESARELDGYRRLDEERPHLMAVLEGCAAEKRWAEARRLVWELQDYLDMQGRWAERVAALHTGLQAARQVGERKDEGAFLGNLGVAYSALGQVAKAIEYYQQALVIAREICDRRGEGNRLGNLGNAYLILGQVEKAIEYYQQALAIDREIGDRRGEGVGLSNLGVAYSALGRVAGAIKYYEQALVIAKEIGDRHDEGGVLGDLGIAYSNLGQVQEAIGYFEQALAIACKIGDRRGEGADLGNLGIAYSTLGQVEKAIEYYQQALIIAREIGDRSGEGNHLGNLGNAYRGLGQVEKAIEYYQQALGIARETGDRRGQGNHLSNLGIAYSDLGQMLDAKKYLKQALEIYQEIKSPYTEKARRLLAEWGE